jgi:hypothetical protein
MSVEDAARNFSLYDTEVMSDPHALYDRLRAQCPVAHSERDEGFWIASKYKDIMAVTADPETYSSRFIMIPRYKYGADFTERPPITCDPPRHTYFRRLLQPRFTHAQAQKWEPLIREVCVEALRPLVDAGGCDIVTEYSRKIPLGFTCKLVGVETSMEDTFSGWCHSMLESDDLDEVQRATGEISQYLVEQVQSRSDPSAPDIITLLANGDLGGEPLTVQDVVATAMVILVAGLDTTWNALSSAILHLADHPDDRRRLVEEPTLIPTAVEELLRFYAPVTLTRETNREVCLSGVTIPKDSLILLNWPAGNRDPEVFTEPDRVIIDRAENPHITFGTGIHRCLGAAIARLELRVAIEEWLRHIPEFELDGSDPVTFGTGHIWGPRTGRLVYPRRNGGRQT